MLQLPEPEIQERLLEDTVALGRGKGCLRRLQQEAAWEMQQGKNLERLRAEHVGVGRWLCSILLQGVHKRTTLAWSVDMCKQTV